MTDDVIAQRIRELIAETDPAWARARRRDYLTDVIWWLNSELEEAREQYRQSFIDDEDFGNRELLASLIEHIEQQKQRHERELKALSSTGKPGVDDLTPKIEQAKARQFSDFLEIRRGMALCPFHDDRSPSFSVKGAKGHCFGCGWSGDVIDFIQQRQGMSFQEAVKYLAG